MNEAVIALKYDCFVLNVTRPDPIGYLYLSVSIPKTFVSFLLISYISFKEHDTKRYSAIAEQTAIITCIDNSMEEIVHDLR